MKETNIFENLKKEIKPIMDKIAPDVDINDDDAMHDFVEKFYFSGQLYVSMNKGLIDFSDYRLIVTYNHLLQVLCFTPFKARIVLITEE